MTNKTTIYKAQRQAMLEAFTRALCTLMHEKGLNQPALSRASGIPSGQISRYCNGSSLPGPRNQERLAKALGCTRTDLTKGWVLKRHQEDYLSVRNASRDRVAIELKQTVSLEQANQIMQILGTDRATA